MKLLIILDKGILLDTTMPNLLMIAFHIFETFCQDPSPLYYIPKPYKETLSRVIKSLIGINKNLDETRSRDVLSAGCLGNNHLGLLGLLGHMIG